MLQPAPAEQGLFFWDSLLEYIQERRVVPIIGAELLTRSSSSRRCSRTQSGRMFCSTNSNPAAKSGGQFKRRPADEPCDTIQTGYGRAQSRRLPYPSDGKLLIVSSWRSYIRLFDAVTYFYSDGRRMAAAGTASDSISVWDFESRERLLTTSHPFGPIGLRMTAGWDADRIALSIRRD